MMNLKKVQGDESFARDERSGAIININMEEINAAKKRKLLRKNKEKEFEDLKNEVGDIKNMLTKIIEKLDG